jgi:hypothetical protein
MTAKAKLKFLVTTLALTTGLVCLFLTGRSTMIRETPSSTDGSPPNRTPSPVLVELFTSEGCSSCPPADELLTRLEQTQPVAGAEVIALSEHVDYWNRLGWTDPYSSAEFSKRQNDYASAFQTDEVYTPQMVVDGGVQFVGSNSNRAREAVDVAARDSKAVVTVSLASEDRAAASITLAVRVAGLPERWKGDSARVLLAITESGLRSNVASGENAGRRLTHSAVVRRLSRLGDINSGESGAFAAQPVVRIEKAWKRDSLRAVVFVQDRSSLRVLGASAASFGK